MPASPNSDCQNKHPTPYPNRVYPAVNALDGDGPQLEAADMALALTSGQLQVYSHPHGWRVTPEAAQNLKETSASPQLSPRRPRRCSTTMPPRHLSVLCLNQPLRVHRAGGRFLRAPPYPQLEMGRAGVAVTSPARARYRYPTRSGMDHRL